MDLLDLLSPIVEIGAGPVSVIAGVFTRISALVFFLPGLGEHTVSTRVRLAAAMAITLIIAPIVLAQTETAPTGASAMTSILAAEAVSGALLGFSIRVLVFILQTAGSIAAQHTSLAQIFGSSIDNQPEPPISSLLMIAGVALALASGLHFHAVNALAVSFNVLPFGVFPGAGETGAWAADRAAFAFSAALSLALPFVILGFIYNLAIGAANRAMPQLMVAFVGAPAITLAGLVLLALAAPAMFAVWLDMIDNVFATLMGAAQ